MLLDDFNLLHEQAQHEMVTDQGVFLINFVQNKMNCDVYGLYEFYVQIRYSLVANDAGRHITAFADPKNFQLCK